MNWRKLLVAFMILICINTLSINCSATSSYKTYSYYLDSTKASPDAMVPVESRDGKNAGSGEWKNPQDLYAYEGKMYIADTDNNRIVITDMNFQMIDVISHLVVDGKESSLNAPKGVFVDKNGICIADAGNARVLVLDYNKNVLLQLKMPKSDLYDSSREFKPQKVLRDKNGYYYVINLGSYEGALLYDTVGDFNSFYGGNRMTVTLELLVENTWRNIMNKVQLSKVAQNIPQEYCNFDLDYDGFIYTCTNNTTDMTAQLKKLNSNGNNVWSSGGNYGDTVIEYDGSTPIVSRMTDIAADDYGFVTAIDSQRGHIFQYSATDGSILFVSSSIGSQLGTFRSPVAVECYGDKIYVLDSDKATVTTFSYTEYGRALRSGVQLLNDGLYDDALESWNEVLKRNGNMHLSYIGIGKSLLGKGEYTEAMKYFKLGNDVSSYSEAFEKYRKDILLANFPWMIALVAILIIGGYVFGYFRKKNRKIDYTIKHYKKWQYPFYIMFHPIKGFDDLKWSKQTSPIASVIILSMWFLSSILKRQETSYIFNSNYFNKISFNLVVQLLSTVGIFVAFVVINWALCTLFEGKGKMSGIFIYTSYALLPVIFYNYISVGLSYILTMNEATFLAIFSWVCIGWSVLLLLRGLSVLHEYELKKVIISVLATVFGMAVLVFLLVLVISLFNNISSFITSIIDEFIMHYVD